MQTSTGFNATQFSAGREVARRDYRVLLVEDDQTIAYLVSTQLHHLNSQVIHASNGVEAIRAWQAGAGDAPFDIVFMDLRMPVMAGWEAINKIRYIERMSGFMRTPIVAFTAETLFDHGAHLIELGFDDVLSKPCGIEQMYGKLVRWCG